jgi:hypothetical protein
MQHRLKALAGATWARIVAAEFLQKLLAAERSVDTSIAVFDACF